MSSDIKTNLKPETWEHLIFPLNVTLQGWSWLLLVKTYVIQNAQLYYKYFSSYTLSSEWVMIWVYVNSRIAASIKKLKENLSLVCEKILSFAKAEWWSFVGCNLNRQSQQSGKQNRQ